MEKRTYRILQGLLKARPIAPSVAVVHVKIHCVMLIVICQIHCRFAEKEMHCNSSTVVTFCQRSVQSSLPPRPSAA